MKCKSIYDAITRNEIKRINTKTAEDYDNDRFGRGSSRQQSTSVLDILDNCNTNVFHLSFDSLLQIIFSDDANIGSDLQLFLSNSKKNLSQYAMLTNRLFLPTLSTSNTVKIT